MNRVVVVVLALILYIPVIGSAGQVGMEKAGRVAQNWLHHCVTAYGSWAGGTSPTILDEEPVVFNGQVVGFNFLIYPMGNILVSARDDIPPVKLYSDTSTLSINSEDTHEQAEWIAEEIFLIGDAIDSHSGDMAGIDVSQNPDAVAWALFGMATAQFRQKYQSWAAGTESVSLGPLLTTTWSQLAPFNLQCPLEASGCQTIVGCVATAAAQIMKFWSKPAKGAGSTSYKWNNGVSDITLSCNFANSTYDWPDMSDNPTTTSPTVQQNAVAQLCANVGIAFHMDYGCQNTGSSAYTSDAPTVFTTYFNYKNTATWVKRLSFRSQSDWMQVFKSEVQSGRPSQLSIRDPKLNEGHSVVVDGYRDSPSESIHLNMGWSGSYNGWYTPDSFITGTYHWTDIRQGAAIGLQPN